MKRLISVLTALTCCVVMSWAQSPLSAASKLRLSHDKAVKSNSLMSSRPGYYQAFISVSDESDIDSLRQHGVVVNSRYDSFMTAQIPASLLPKVAKMQGVSHIALAQPLQLHNDSARYHSAVDEVHQAVGQIAPLTGKGVIVGVVDIGIDFNHISFRDAEGRSRVLAVYMPDDSTGVRPIVRGDTLPGSCYETPEQIAQLTTDYTGSSHGTHTTGTAAGSYKENGWYGVAPEADIIACAMPEDALTTVNIANSVNYIFDYADRVGKPCVINMSIGDNWGPNDGTSFLCKAYESASGPGRICVLSAGNDGNGTVCLHRTLVNRNDTLTTLLGNYTSPKGYVSMWSDREQVHRSRIVIINKNTHELEYASPFVDYIPEDSVYTISSDNDTLFAAYFTGKLELASEMFQVPGNPDSALERYHSLWSVDAKAAGNNTHLLGLQYVSDELTHLVGWSSKLISFSDYGIEGVERGSQFGSISDLATTDSVISVGAYCSRKSYIDKNGSVRNIGLSDPYNIAYFSSFGPDERGISRPDVCAPGMSLISSANRYNTTANRQYWPSPVMVDGEEYPYYSNQGTSMSAPVVTGAVALMLQVNPSLSVSDVRAVLKRTSVIDSYVANDEPERWGSGKLNVQAAIADVIDNTLLPGDVNQDHDVNIVDVSQVIEMILGDISHHDAVELMCADVNHDCSISISDVSYIIDLILR